MNGLVFYVCGLELITLLEETGTPGGVVSRRVCQ